VNVGRFLAPDGRSKSKTVAPKGKAIGAIRKSSRHILSGPVSRRGFYSPPEQRLQLLPGKAVQNGSFFKAGATRLVDSTPDKRQFARAMGIGVDGDQHTRGLCLADVFRRKVQTVRA